MPLVADRTLLVPTAHEDEALAFDAYAEVFERPHALLVNTPEELDLIHRRFPRHARARVVGVGVEPPAVQPGRFRTRFEVPGPYLLYVGRVERGKGIPGAARGVPATSGRRWRMRRPWCLPVRRAWTCGRKECGCWVG